VRNKQCSENTPSVTGESETMPVVMGRIMHSLNIGKTREKNDKQA
jgi:hypothetical protein